MNFKFIDTETLPLRPSYLVLMYFYFIGAILALTDYNESLTIDRSGASYFIKSAVSDSTLFLNVIDDRVNDKLKGFLRPEVSRDRTERYLIRFFNPLQIFSDKIGLFSTWVVWQVLVFFFAFVFRSDYIVALSQSIPDANIPIRMVGGSFFIVYFVLSSILFLFYLIRANRKSVI